MEQFVVHEIVKDLHLKDKPETELIVKFENGSELKCGNELTPTRVKDVPTTIDWDADPESFYSLVFLDPDAPSRAEPKVRSVLHWLVVNIPGKNVSAGDEFVEYIGSGAPKGTGLHRYTYLVFRQASKLTLNLSKTTKYSRTGRYSFQIHDFVQEHSLIGPVAGNFYQAQFDDYVPILHEQLNRGN